MKERKTNNAGLVAGNDTNHRKYDIIGDIHGYADALEALLRKLGYDNKGETWCHPGGRKALFVGDFIDRGPKIPETLRMVKGMVDAGEALAVMGNHEFNALAYATPDGRGGWVREHKYRNAEQHAETLDQFAGREEEWRGYLDWFRDLPLWIELPGIRVVHAAWDTRATGVLGSDARMDEALVRAAGTPGTPEYAATETLLKGVELPLPDGHFFLDEKSFPRHRIRTRWWRGACGETFRSIALQTDAYDIPELPADAHATMLPGYGADERPVFNGHYWLKGEPELMAPNVAILDYSVARDGVLTAYRWDGERTLDATKFVQVRAEEEAR